MKRFLAIILSLILILIQTTTLFAEAKENQPLKIVGILVNGKTMLPVREIFENLGATVLWNAETQTVTAKNEKFKFVMVVGESWATINEKKVKMDQPPTIFEEKIIVPIRFISETMGYKVTWDESKRVALIGDNIIISVRNSFTEPLAVVKLDDKFGYVDRTGRIVIEPMFDRAYEFSEGLARIFQDKKFGFIDKAGNIVIKPQFTIAQEFSEGLAAVEIEGKWGFIDKLGTIKIPPKFDHVGRFSDGLAAYYVLTKSHHSIGAGVIDKSGNIIIDHTKYVTIGEFQHGYASVTYGERNAFDTGSSTGFINKSGELVNIQFNYLENDLFGRGIMDSIATINRFVDGYSIANFGTYGITSIRYGIIDKDFNVVIGPKRAFKRIMPGSLSNGLFIGFEQNGDVGFYDVNHNQVIDLNKLDIQRAEPFFNGISSVQLSDGTWGMMDINGQIVKTTFQKIGKFHSPDSNNIISIYD